MNDSREIVRQLLRKILNNKSDIGSFADSDSMIFSGRLQSVDVLDIVLFLEERFGLDFSEGFDQSDLDSVDRITELIQTRG
jgi:acyl carrier protein